MKKIKNLLALLLSIIVLLQSQFISQAYYKYVPTSGKCGNNLSWNFDEYSGKLTVSGKGKMTNYSNFTNVPWYDIKQYITDIVIDESVESIGDYAFYYCTYVDNIKIGKKVNRIGKFAFSYCTNLEKIVIPSSVKTMDSITFAHCSYLRNVVINSGLKSIPSTCFLECENLKTITIPKSVEKIDPGAFSDCYSLNTVFYTGSRMAWNKIKISKVNNEKLVSAKKKYITSSKVPTITKINALSKGVKLKWKKVSGVSGYQISYSTSSKFKNARIITISGNKTFSKSVKKLKGKKKYYIRIRTYKNANGVKVYSKWSGVKSAKTKN